MKLLLRYLQPESNTLLLALFAAIVNQVFSLLNPQIFGRIVDDYASNVNNFTRSEFIEGVGILLIVYVLFALISRIAKAFQDYFVNTVSEKVGTERYGSYVRNIFRMPYEVFENEHSGSILQKMQKARDQMKKLIGDLVNIGFFSLIGIIFVLIYALTIHPLIALVFFLAIPVMSIVIAMVGKSVKNSQKLIVQESADLAASTTETLQNVGLVKSLGLEDQEILRLNALNTKILGLEIKKVVILRKLSFIQGTLVNAISSLIILVSMVLIANADISLGEFLTLWFYGFFVFGPLSQVADLVSSYQEAIASVEEIESIMNKLPTEPSSESNQKEIDSITSVEFNDVSFRYRDNSNDSLEGISVAIERGQTVAFVGPSGSGKSTILKLILGLYEPSSGTLTYNKESREYYNSKSIRQRIGYVPQDTQVFAGTIRDNLQFVKPEASDEECLRALKQAEALPIIERQGKGLDTIIGERGIKLSGGERQRIAIARALLRTPDLLIFDEATSSLDSRTEAEITKTIKEIRKDHPHMIMIIVAHRLSTVEHADIIYGIAQGKIQESGTHQELLSLNGLYTNLYYQQQNNNT